MAWDAARPVPWKRLMKEWVIYAGIMTAVFLLLFRDSNVAGAIAGVLISGPLYLVLGAVLAKFGYTRKSMKEMRSGPDDSSPGDTAASADGTSDGGTPQERRPAAPTKRTSSGRNRPTAKQKRR
jgi:hypothetical protein